ncbi:MAG: type II secretion system protein GspN [bacterium]|nr:type II secretion system protein GspN [bacterium]
MDAKDVKIIIRSGLKGAVQIVKDTIKLPYAKTYIFLSIILTLIFVIFTFPYEILIRSQLQELEKGTVKNISVGAIDFSLIDASMMNNISTTLNNGNDISIKKLDVDVTLNPYTLLVSKLYEGKINISGAKFSSEKITVNTSIDSEFEIETDTETGDLKSGFIKLKVSGAMIQSDNIILPDSMLGMALPTPIRFGEIILESKLEGKKLKINKFTFSGADVNGRITGSITLAKRMENSKLAITIILDKESGLIKNKFAPFLSAIPKNMLDAKGNIKISLTGTISRPRTAGSKSARSRSDASRPSGLPLP